MSISSVSGVASGIQWRDMVDQIMALEAAPIDRLDRQKKLLEARTAAWATFRTRVTALETAAKALAAGTALRAVRTSVTTSATRPPLAASAGTDALPGSYDVSVLSLATREKLGGSAFADRTAALGLAGEFLVGGRRVAVTAADSLDAVAARINDANTGTTPSGVTAAVTATASGSYRLVLTAAHTGATGIRLADASGDVLRGLGVVDDATSLRSVTGDTATGDAFASRSADLGTLLGLTGAGPQTVQVNGTDVALDLATMSLDEVATALNDAAEAQNPGSPAFSASVLTETVNGKEQYRLQVSGTTGFADAGRVLETLGILSATRTSAAQELRGSAWQDVGGAASTGTSTLAQLTLDGAARLVQDTDTVTFRATRPDGSTFERSFAAAATLDVIVTALNGTDAFRAAGSPTATATLENGSIVIRDDAQQDSLLALDITVAAATGQIRDAGLGALTVTQGRSRLLTAGQDARVRIDGTYITRSTNAISDAVPGLTLNLSATGDATVDVARDANAGTAAIKGLVDAYNALSDFVAQQTTVAAGGTPPPLYGDTVLRSMRTSLRNGLAASIDASVAGGYTRLADLGIEVDRYGRYTVDDAKLGTAVSTRSDDVARLFGIHGSTVSSGFTYLGASDATQSGTHAVAITQPATQAAATAALDAGVTITDGDALVLRDLFSGKHYRVALFGRTLAEVAGALQAELDTAEERVLRSTGPALAADALLTDPATGITAGDRLTLSGTRANGTSFMVEHEVTATDTLASLGALLEAQLGGDASVAWTGSGFQATSSATGSSSLTLAVRNETAASDPFGSFGVITEGRPAARIAAASDGSTLTLTHAEYGSLAGFELWYEDGAGVAKDVAYDPLQLLADGTTTVTHRGQDVAGTIAGAAATGSGRTLTAAAGASEGLRVQYGGTLAAAGSVTFSRGIGSLVELAARALTQTGSGRIDTITQALDSRVQSLTDRADTISQRLELRREELIRRFTAMEQAMARAQSQSAWLTAQLARFDTGGKD